MIEFAPKEDTEESYQDVIQTVFNNTDDSLGVVLHVNPPDIRDEELDEMNADLKDIFHDMMSTSSSGSFRVSHKPRKTWSSRNRNLFRELVKAMFAEIDLTSNRQTVELDFYLIKPSDLATATTKLYRSSDNPAVCLYAAEGTSLFSEIVTFLDFNA